MRVYSQSDADTLKERDIKLSLTDEETRSLLLEAARRNTTVEELLEDFVANLTGSIRSRGSDERDLAERYVDRCIYSFDDNESFLQWLSIYGDLTGALIDLNAISEISAHRDRYEEPDVDLEYYKQSLEEAYGEYRSAGGKEGYDEALERLRDYQKTKERVKV